MKKSNNPNDNLMMTKKKGFVKMTPKQLAEYKNNNPNAKEIERLEKNYTPKRFSQKTTKNVVAPVKPTPKKVQLKMRKLK